MDADANMDMDVNPDFEVFDIGAKIIISVHCKNQRIRIVVVVSNGGLIVSSSRAPAGFSVGTTSNDPIARNNAVESIVRSTPDH